MGTDFDTPFLCRFLIDVKANFMFILAKSDHSARLRKEFQITDRQDAVVSGLFEIGEHAGPLGLCDEQYLAARYFLWVLYMADKNGPLLHQLSLQMEHRINERAFTRNTIRYATVAAKRVCRPLYKFGKILEHGRFDLIFIFRRNCQFSGNENKKQCHAETAKLHTPFLEPVR